ncbi:VOC family protein [Nitratireductor luteus]|uniref:VOC family protein n=1 Tax=Nitratireductor luteus TaxID=2976980 RepID=UPI00223FDD24|nr:VOC family protein [Nitratireductor luteus]
MNESTRQAPSIFPTFRYRDASAMVEWLEKALGFTAREKHMDGNRVAHAEMVLGASIVMLGDAADDAYGAMVGTSGATGGKSTYIAVEDATAAYEKAKDAGAEILQKLVERSYGSTEFICRDPEGNVWCVGTYWPKAGNVS